MAICTVVSQVSFVNYVNQSYCLQGGSIIGSANAFTCMQSRHCRRQPGLAACMERDPCKDRFGWLDMHIQKNRIPPSEMPSIWLDAPPKARDSVRPSSPTSVTALLRA